MLSTLWRMLWRARQPAVPGPMLDAGSLEVLARQAMHPFLLGGSLVVAISGAFITLCVNHDVGVLGLLTLPAQGEVMVIAVHALAALKHHFVEHDATFRRMLGRGA